PPAFAALAPPAVSLHRGVAGVDTHDDLRLARTRRDVPGRLGGGELAVHERVGAELLDEVDVHRERTLGALGGDVERLGAEPERDLTLVVLGERVERRAR